MADKVYKYINTTIDQDTVQDWTTRLTKLQTAGGITNQTHNRSVGDIVKKAQTLDIYNDVIYTKNNIANLSGATLLSYTDTSTGKVMDKNYLIGTIEKNIGTLEQYCIAFTPKCTHNNASFKENASSYSSNNSATHSAKTCTFNNSGFYSANKKGNFGAFHSANCGTVFSSVRSTNDPFNYMHFHSGRSGCSTQKVHVHGSHNKTFHTSKSANFVSVTKNSSDYELNFTHFKCAHNKAGNFTANYSADFSNHNTGNTSYCVFNKSGNFTVNFKSDDSTCIVVHSAYEVEGIDFVPASGE